MVVDIPLHTLDVSVLEATVMTVITNSSHSFVHVSLWMKFVHLLVYDHRCNNDQSLVDFSITFGMGLDKRVHNTRSLNHKHYIFDQMLGKLSLLIIAIDAQTVLTCSKPFLLLQSIFSPLGLKYLWSH